MDIEKARRSNQGISRRTMLQTGLAAVCSVSSLQAGSATSTGPKRSGARAIDTHAHYYPQAYLDVIKTEGKRFNAEYRMTDQGFYFRTADESDGPLPIKFIDLNQRLADMDAQGVAVQPSHSQIPWSIGLTEKSPTSFRSRGTTQPSPRTRLIRIGSWSSQPYPCSILTALSTNSTGSASYRVYAASIWAPTSKAVT